MSGASRRVTNRTECGKIKLTSLYCKIASLLNRMIGAYFYAVLLHVYHYAVALATT